MSVQTIAVIHVYYIRGTIKLPMGRLRLDRKLMKQLPADTNIYMNF